MRFVVIGGGCYGTFYARQLIRAAESGAIPRPEIIVVDHGAAPQVAKELKDERVQHLRAEWQDFFDDYLPTVPTDSTDQIVPPPFTPHLALAWLQRALARDGAHIHWRIEPFMALPGTPFVNHNENGTMTASHADWICPIHCIEPETCPKTRGPRDWDMADTARALAAPLARAGQPVDQIHLLQCLHFTHGVGTYPAAVLSRAFEEMSRLRPTPQSPVRALVGTVSRCHGAMHLLKGEVGTDTVSPPGTFTRR